MSEVNWRADPDLVRTPDEDDLQRIPVTEQWERVFEQIGLVLIGPSEGMWAKGGRAMFKGIVWQMRKKVAADPDGARNYVVDALRIISACLEVEPIELYPDLKQEPAPAPPAAAVAT
jgi:hypothetical protein